MTEKNHKNQHAPSVSVAIACYNTAAYVSAAVRSALSQSLAEIEVILVDDCSTDDTFSVLQRLEEQDSRVRAHRLQRNGGPAAARNAALNLARGRWFAVLDSDDLYAPDRLERLVATAEEMNADIISDNLVVFDDGVSSSARMHLPEAFARRWVTLADYLKETRMFGGGLEYGYLKPMIRTERLRSLELRYNESLRIAEDDDLILRAMLSGMTYFIEPSPTYGYRKHGSSISHRLPESTAEAIADAGTRLHAEHAHTSYADQLKNRATAFRNAREFARFIARVQSRRFAAAAAVALKSPGMVPLLRMPVGAALRRLFWIGSVGAPPERSEAISCDWITSLETHERPLT